MEQVAVSHPCEWNGLRLLTIQSFIEFLDAVFDGVHSLLCLWISMFILTRSHLCLGKLLLQFFEKVFSGLVSGASLALVVFDFPFQIYYLLIQDFDFTVKFVYKFFKRLVLLFGPSKALNQLINIPYPCRLLNLLKCIFILLHYLRWYLLNLTSSRTLSFRNFPISVDLFLLLLFDLLSCQPLLFFLLHEVLHLFVFLNEHVEVPPLLFELLLVLLCLLLQFL